MKKMLICLVLLLSTQARALPVASYKGIVVSAHQTASQAGVQMLKQGGNAVDAAVATAFALAVVEPYSSGLGGGGFALIRQAQHLYFLDFRETAPQAATQNMFVTEQGPQLSLSRDSALGVATPGAVAGYLEMQQRFGKLTRAQVLMPAIAAAEKGFTVDERYRLWTQERLDVLQKDPEATRIFLKKNKQGQVEVPDYGTIIVQKDLANTLKQIALKGAHAFYQGSVAQAIVQDIQQRGGILTLHDLETYRVREREPLIGHFRGKTIVTAPPPSSGGAILLTTLNIMENLPLGTAWHSSRALIHYLEASKYAYADRALMGDSDFVPELKTTLPLLLDKERAHRISERIQLAGVQPATQIMPAAEMSSHDVQPVQDDPGPHTSHVSTIDQEGNAVSMTTTINYTYGAGFVARGTGIVMNDEMDDFSIGVGVANAYGIVGSKANAIAPFKVPLSSMTPTMVFQGDNTESPLQLVIGSPGGSRIPSAVTQAILNILEYNIGIDQAMNLGRIHHQHLPDIVRMEPQALEPATQESLIQAGYHLEQQRVWCNVMGIVIDEKSGLKRAAADRRGVGVALAQ